jgi:hypothetical protein
MSLGKLWNYYRKISVESSADGKDFWILEDYDNDKVEEIPEYLYNVLVKFETERLEGEQHES